MERRRGGCGGGVLGGGEPSNRVPVGLSHAAGDKLLAAAGHETALDTTSLEVRIITFDFRGGFSKPLAISYQH